MKFSKKLAQRPKQGMTDLEKRLWQLETTINFKQNPDYRSCKEKLDKRHEKKVNVLRIRDNNKKIWPLIPCGFSKNVSSRERVKHWGFFVIFDTIVSHIFPWKFHWNLSIRSVVGIRLFLLGIWRGKGRGVKPTRPPPPQRKLLSKSPALLGLNNMPRDKSPGNDELTKEFKSVISSWHQSNSHFLFSKSIF